MPAAERTALDYLYDGYRTALLNRLHYRETLGRRRRWTTALDIPVAAGGSGVARLAGAGWTRRCATGSSSR